MQRRFCSIFHSRTLLDKKYIRKKSKLKKIKKKVPQKSFQIGKQRGKGIHNPVFFPSVCLNQKNGNYLVMENTPNLTNESRNVSNFQTVKTSLSTCHNLPVTAQNAKDSYGWLTIISQSFLNTSSTKQIPTEHPVATEANMTRWKQKMQGF